MMMRFIITGSVLLILTACVAQDPYTQRAAAEGAIQATSVARQVNAASTSQAMDAAAIEATRYAGELVAVEAQIRGTQAAVEAEQTAIAMQATRAAADLQATSARATSQIVQMQSTQAYLVEYVQAMGTATAVVQVQNLEFEQRASDYRRANAWRWLWFGLALILELAIGAFLAVAIYTYLMLRKAKVAAVFGMSSPGDLPLLQPNIETRLLRFLRDARAVVGANSQQLPRFDAMPGWNANSWSDMAHQLQRAGLLTIRSQMGRSSGSFIREPYLSVGRLIRAIETGQVKLPPYPTAIDAWKAEQNTEQNTNTGFDVELEEGEYYDIDQYARV